MNVVLSDSIDVAFQDVADRFFENLCTSNISKLQKRAVIVIIRNRKGSLANNIARVDPFIDVVNSYTKLFLIIDESPVEDVPPTIIRKLPGMTVNNTKRHSLHDDLFEYLVKGHRNKKITLKWPYTSEKIRAIDVAMHQEWYAFTLCFFSQLRVGVVIAGAHECYY
jgi:hypothetical protein